MGKVHVFLEELGYRGISARISDAVSPPLHADNLRSSLHLYYRGSRRGDKSVDRKYRGNSSKLNRMIGRKKEKKGEGMDISFLQLRQCRLNTLFHRKLCDIHPSLVRRYERFKSFIFIFFEARYFLARVSPFSSSFSFFLFILIRLNIYLEIWTKFSKLDCFANSTSPFPK